MQQPLTTDPPTAPPSGADLSPLGSDVVPIESIALTLDIGRLEPPLSFIPPHFSGDLPPELLPRPQPPTSSGLDFTLQIPPIPPSNFQPPIDFTVTDDPGGELKLLFPNGEASVTADLDGNVTLNGHVGDVSAGVGSNRHLTLNIGHLHLSGDVASGSFSGSFSGSL